MEGVEKNKVRLLPHNPEWDTEFLRVSAELQKIWGENILDLQHVGSTAIKAICAKPILDIAVRLNAIEKMEIGRLTAIGYDYRGEQFGNPKYHLFVLRGENQISLRHIHCYDRDEKEFELLVGFRDYLNAHIDAALQYEKIKKELLKKYPDDRVSYTRGKEAFIKSIYSILEMTKNQNFTGRGMNDFVIREMRKEEYPLLEDFLYEAIFIPKGTQKPPRDIIKNEELQVYVKDFGTKKDDYCLVAEYDHKIVGACWTRIMNDYGHIDSDTPSFAISLYEEYRGNGMGTGLMKSMLKLLKKEGYGRASLSVQKDNYAVKMYQNIGFKIVDENREEYIMVCYL